MNNLKVINAEIKVLSETIDTILDRAQILTYNNQDASSLIDIADSLCTDLNLVVNQLKQQFKNINEN